MRITVKISVEIEEADGDGNTFALTRAVSAGDSPAFVKGEVEKVLEPAVMEITNRVSSKYQSLR